MRPASRALTLGVPLLVALAFLFAAVPFLGEFGPTWDTSIGEFAHGELYLAYATTGDARFLDFSDAGARPIHREPHPDFAHGLNFWKDSFPLGGILSAISCRLLWTTLGWMPAMEAHDLPVLLFCALLLFALLRFALPRFGALPAFAAVAFLLTSPRFLTDQFNNLKDAPETCLYVLTLLVFFRALERESNRLMAGAGALTGLALAQKVNALLLPVHALLLWIVLLIIHRARGARGPALPWRGLLLAIPLCAACFLAVSPMLWSDPVGRTLEHFQYYTSLGFRHWIPRFPGFIAFVSTTPLPLLALGPLGAFSRRANPDERALLVVGAAFPLLRVSMPWADNFDGVRHFLEFYPFYALLAGLAVTDVAELVAKKFWRVPLAAVVMLALLPGALGVVQTWPYGTVYFNAILGGLGGAQARGIKDATDYWANSYWEALERVKHDGPYPASILVPIAPQVARAALPVRFAPFFGDFWLDPSHPIPPERNAAIIVMYVTRYLARNEIVDWCEANARPEYEIRRDGGVLLKAFFITDPKQIAELKTIDDARFRLEAAVDRIYRELKTMPDAVVGRWVDLLRTKDPKDLATVEEEMRRDFPDWLHRDLNVLFPQLPALLERLEATKPAGK